MQSFLIINGANSPVLDVFFQYCTFFGDGLIYIPLLLYCLFFNRRFAVTAVLGILICLLLTHVLKRIVFPNELRPVSLEAQGFLIHKIAGVHMNRLHSFPSGHTATAFSTALLLVTVLRNRTGSIFLLLVPFLVAYSRVYLGQHFVTDILGGMVVGMVTAALALWLQPFVLNRLPVTVQRRLKHREPA